MLRGLTCGLCLAYFDVTAKHTCEAWDKLPIGHLSAAMCLQGFVMVAAPLSTSTNMGDIVQLTGERTD
jgi:hypothetical protein